MAHHAVRHREDRVRRVLIDTGDYSAGPRLLTGVLGAALVVVLVAVICFLLWRFAVGSPVDGVRAARDALAAA